MIDRVCADMAAAVADIDHGARVMISGFGEAGRPNALIAALLDKGVRDLEIISNNPGDGETGLGALFVAGRVRRLTCSYPRGAMAALIERQVRAGQLLLDVRPQGTLAECIRAGGAGIPAFFTPTGFGTRLAEGKETRDFEGRGHVLEMALTADFALVRADRADRWGNLTYRRTARNFGPLMCMAARVTIVEAAALCALGALDPETVATPGIFVDRVVPVGAVAEAGA